MRGTNNRLVAPQNKLKREITKQIKENKKLSIYKNFKSQQANLFIPNFPFQQLRINRYNDGAQAHQNCSHRRT